MTIEPISDERLAEIRAAAEASRGVPFKAWPRVSPTTLLALLARLDKAEAGCVRKDATFEVHQDGTPVAMASGPRDRAYAEAMHYASVYGQDGPVEVFEHVPVTITSPRNIDAEG